MRRHFDIYLVLSILVLASGLLHADCGEQVKNSADGSDPTPSEIDRFFGQTLYVPVYSHIYNFSRKRRYNLAATLSIRNTDLDHPITVTSVQYFGSDGTLLKDYLQKHLRLDQLASVDYVVDERDTEGGSGANFVVRWGAEKAVTAPVIESVMISSGTQGVSFLSPGRVIRQCSP